jgi:hypothetical protein
MVFVVDPELIVPPVTFHVYPLIPVSVVYVLPVELRHAAALPEIVGVGSGYTETDSTKAVAAVQPAALV